MDARQQAYLKAMGIDIWLPRSPAATMSDSAAVEPLPEISVPSTQADQPEPGNLTGLDWSTLEARVSNCSLCSLHQGRSQTVFGVGNPQADLMIIGEAPGAEEDHQGEPFVGRAGQLLNAMLRAINFERQTVYITNLLKCHPPENRDPTPAELAQCRPYLQRQIELIQPKVILVVGGVAAQTLLQTDTKVGQLRGQLYSYPPTNTPLIVTYHPAYLLRKPLDKGKVWQDLLFVKKTLGDQGQAV